ncbi:hypothetical protein Vretifemale_6136 [Volvox reticuliferus]|uniref:Guanylate-binding protein N-terminal domain-containing protein n=1 Tax=Volvox reticuliferus TaxID=1737510 RepID=A0A8J4FHK4_9CHLO|nr:hypothetical protein Vretifemale_6136 [Volvox reticuliferus]
MTSEFFCFNKDMKNFEIQLEALDLLRSLNTPVCVVAICGRSVAGKTSLLNQLAARLRGPMRCPEGASAHPLAVGTSCRFAGGTLKHSLKGVWQWTRSSEWKLPCGQMYHVLLLDAEAIGASEQTPEYSNHIFNLSVLLSSVLLYHQTGSIDDQSVDDLAGSCGFALSPGDEMGISAVPLDLSPAFLWLLRGFQMQIAGDGKQLTYREYMEGTLEPLPGRTAAVRAKNQARASIKALFPDRDCHVLPLHAEALLARTDSLPALEPRIVGGFLGGNGSTGQPAPSSQICSSTPPGAMPPRSRRRSLFRNGVLGWTEDGGRGGRIGLSVPHQVVSAPPPTASPTVRSSPCAPPRLSRQSCPCPSLR